MSENERSITFVIAIYAILKRGFLRFESVPVKKYIYILVYIYISFFFLGKRIIY